MKNYVLVGNYGVGNFGDEALKQYFLDEYDECKWSVLSAQPSKREFSRLPSGIRSFLSFQWMRTLREIKKSEGMVFGGGTLFTDIESVLACFLWWIHARTAQLFGKKTYFAFQGFGPFKSRLGQWFAASALKRAEYISLRDSLSAKRYMDTKVNKNYVQTFDPIFSLIQNEKHDDSTKKVLILIPRNNSGATFQLAMQNALRSQHYDEVRVLSMKPDDAQEREFIEKLKSSCTARVSVHATNTLSDIIDGLSDADSVISERYHGAIAAIALGKALSIVSQGNGDKLSALREADPPEELLRLVLLGENTLKDALSLS